MQFQIKRRGYRLEDSISHTSKYIDSYLYDLNTISKLENGLSVKIKNWKECDLKAKKSSKIFQMFFLLFRIY